MRFAARRAQKTGGGVVHAVRDRAGRVPALGRCRRTDAPKEARDTAEARLGELAVELQDLCGVTPEFVIREGNRSEEVLTLIEDDKEIGVLVLGAGEGDNPGPLVSQMVARMGGRMPIPVTVVPGAMSLERIDAVC